MTQEEKQLLLKDLCARLPYEVKGRVYAEITRGDYDMNGDMIFFDSPFDVTLDGINTSTEEIHVIAIGNESTVDFIEEQQTDGKPYTIDEFKPYLRSMSSMTEDEEKEFKEVIELEITALSTSQGHTVVTAAPSAFEIDFYLKHHFDFRGLIEKGLALEAPSGMYK